MDREIILPSDIKERYQEDYHVAVLLGYHNALARIEFLCSDCCAHDRDYSCSICGNRDLSRQLKTKLNNYGTFMDNCKDEDYYKKILVDREFDLLTKVDPELKFFRKPKNAKESKTKFITAQEAKQKVQELKQEDFQETLEYIFEQIGEAIENRCSTCFIELGKRKITDDLLDFLKDKGFEVSVYSKEKIANQIIVKWK
jgi:hypothetical protein